MISQRGLAVIATTAVLISLVILFGYQIRTAWMTGLAYMNLIATEGAWRPLSFLTTAPTKETVTIEKGPNNLVADLYLPKQARGRSPAILLYTPFVAGTRADTRITNLADTFSRLGYVVMIPERISEAGARVQHEDVRDASMSWHYLRDHPDTDDRAIIPFGLSYGFGPLFVAVMDETEIREVVPFFAGFGGYAEPESVVKFALTGSFQYGEISGTREPDPWLTDIAKENLKRLVGATATQKLVISEANRFDEIYKQLPASYHKYAEHLSPLGWIGKSPTPLLLIHSTDDNVVPYTESLKLRDARLAAGQPVTLSLVNIFEHGAYKTLTWNNLRRAYLPSFGASYKFLWNFFQLTPQR